ncbi:MAG: nitrogen fixation protein NifM [Candidatus Thiodiazotropha sp. (ex. Lucinoma kazani)]
MTQAEQHDEISPEFSYHLLRNALNGFHKNLSQLDPTQYQEVYRKASKSYELESLVIASPESEGVFISQQQLDQSMTEVASRYEDNEAFIQDLESNGLDEAGLRKALHRELMFDSIMQRVAANSANITELDIHLFYEMHHERFQTPETRTARHILITVNPDFPENRRDAALDRINQAAEKLAGRTNRFGEFAKQYSECPTAMEGGKLGEIRRGQLYKSLDAVLFRMEAEQISPIVESEMGFHILYCEKIKVAMKVPLSKAVPRISEVLQHRQRRNCQKAWLASLQKIEHA